MMDKLIQLRNFALVGFLAGIGASFEGAYAAPFVETYYGFKERSMGGAAIAVTEDEEAAFLNPAGLYGNRSSRMHLIVLDGMVGDDLWAFSETKSIGNISGDVINELIIGRNIYGQYQVAPTLLLDNFAFAILHEQQVASYSDNKALPSLYLGYRATNGAQISFGQNLFGRAERGTELRLGLTGKILWRRGGYEKVPISDLISLSKARAKQFVGDYNENLLFDFGLTFVEHASSELSFRAGFVTYDFGMAMHKGNGYMNGGNTTLGAGLVYDASFVRFSMDYDYRHFFEVADWRKKTHLGFGVELPIFSFYAGLNQLYVTYGMRMNLGLFRLGVASYGEEVGVESFQDTDRRYMIRFDLVLPLF